MNLENFNSELRKFFNEPEAEKRNKGKALINQLIEDIRDNDWYCLQYWGESNLHEWEKVLLVAGLESLLGEGENWVSIEDRLPDGDVASVLIYTNKGGVSEGQYYPSIKSWKQFRWSVENADVTHWKPLPAPPKERFGSLLGGESDENSKNQI